MGVLGLALVLLVSVGCAWAGDLSGYVALEYRGFTQSKLSNEQFDNGSVSVSFEPELYHEWNGGDDSLNFIPFMRWDERDPQRSHVDIRELVWLHVEDDWELRVGIDKVFWGVAESQHLVDIINQSDTVDNLDGEQKLGQPMIAFSLIKDWGALDIFVLPGFRERTFAGKEGRFRSLPEIDDHAEYESGAKHKHVDYALRWSQTFDDWDVGVSHFYGTSREPRIIPTLSPAGLVLTPFYDIINQTGLDVQATLDEWLWKAELIHRSGQGETFNAFTGGFEYTFVGVMDSVADFGVIAEYLYDDRGTDATTGFDNDVFIGGRLAMNDVASSEVLFGVVADVNKSTRFYNVEASRRFGDSWVLSVEARFFSSGSSSDPLNSIRHDDVVQIELARHF